MAGSPLWGSRWAWPDGEKEAEQEEEEEEEDFFLQEEEEEEQLEEVEREEGDEEDEQEKATPPVSLATVAGGRGSEVPPVVRYLSSSVHGRLRESHPRLPNHGCST